MVKVRVEPVGRWYEAQCLRKRQKQTLSEHSVSDSSSSDQGESVDESDEADEALLQSLDPREWKVHIPIFTNGCIFDVKL